MEPVFDVISVTPHKDYTLRLEFENSFGIRAMSRIKATVMSTLR